MTMARIIARRIPSPLAGPTDCPTGQYYDPNYVYGGGIPNGACVPVGTPPTGSKPAPGFFDSVIGALFPKPTVPTMMPPMMPPSGISTNTMLAIGIGAIGLVTVVLLASRRD